jgi:hypothetical protein
MSPQGYDDKWGCTLTTNNKIRFSGGKDDKRNSEEEKRIIRCQEMDDCNNIMLPHPKRGGLEGGRLGMRRNK